MSVAAVDSSGTVASFSQQNGDVEVAAPGVSVLSTTPFKSSTLAVGGNSYIGSPIEGAATTSATGALVDGGLCASVGAWSEKIVLCARGTVSFADKVANAKAGGGVYGVNVGGTYFASDETVTSMVWPGLVNGGNCA